MPTRTLPKMSKLCFRFSENQKMKVRRPPKNHEQSMKKRLRKHVGKKSPQLIQNGSTWAQEVRGFSGFRLLGPSMFRFRFFVVFCCFLWPSWGILGPSWDQLVAILRPFWYHFVPSLDQCLLRPLCLVCLHFFDFFNCFFPGPGGLRAAL